MIVTRLRGGLGNQMFQFSAGKALSLKHSVPLFIDTSCLEQDLGEGYTNRKLELQQFTTNLNVTDRNILTPFNKSKLQKFLGINSHYKTISEGETISNDFFNIKPPVLLDGFWQSEKYFKDYRKELLQIFKPSYDLEAESEGWLEKATSSTSVSVHIRRGDYVSLKSASEFHGVLGMEYYQMAMDYFRERIENVNFFVFSDDIAWCRSALNESNINFVDIKSGKSSLDLSLMSQCNHNIIANSSYSWWGAWLNGKPDKTVIAPLKWFKNKPVAEGMIYCDDWKII